MKFANLLTKFYFEPWCIRPDKHAAMGRLLTEYLKQPKAFMDENDTEGSAGCEVECYSGIAWIPVHGVLGKNLSLLELMCGGCDYNDIAEAVEETLADPMVHTLLLDFDTPGGMLLGLPELAARIKSASQTKRVIAWSEAQCCSAGYWLASQCQEFHVTPSSQIGCIGTYNACVDSSREWEMTGFKLELFKSGKLKALGLEGKAWTDEEREFMQSRADKHGAEFRSAVTAARPGIEQATMEGQWFDGADAVSLGLADSTVNRLEDLVFALLSAPPI
jgi:ClpP class serine protease